jgi:hypothetical protein
MHVGRYGGEGVPSSAARLEFSGVEEERVGMQKAEVGV